MKRFLSVLLAAALLCLCLSGCGGAPDNRDDGRVRVVVTIFPLYDWIRNIAGDSPGLDVVWLLDSGVDLHSYQPSVKDMLTISTCDVFVFVGGESDGWVHDALADADNKSMTVVNLMDGLGSRLREEETLEGMEASPEEPGEDTEYDEHVWLSLTNADAAAGLIAEALSEADPANADTYRSNAEAYQLQLQSLDSRYRAVTDAAARRTLLFGDRFPFRYLAEDYGLTCYAAFAGCSAETEASFDTVAFLAGKVDELSLPAVLTIEGGDQRLAETIVESTNSRDQAVLTLDSMQGVSARDVSSGKTYLSIMEDNLAVLETALN